MQSHLNHGPCSNPAQRAGEPTSLTHWPSGWSFFLEGWHLRRYGVHHSCSKHVPYEGRRGQYHCPQIHTLLKVGHHTEEGGAFLSKHGGHNVAHGCEDPENSSRWLLQILAAAISLGLDSKCCFPSQVNSN